MEDFPFDHFIDYSGSPSLFTGENFPELSFSLSSPFNDSDPTQTTPPFQAQKSNISSHSDHYFSSPDQQQYNEPYKYKPFTIIRNSPIEYGELCSNSKKIQKRNQAKERTRKKQELADLLSKAAKKYIPEGIEDPKLDVKSKRRLVQIVKNRVSAQRTRDHRKKYINELEEVKARLAEANHELLERNRMLEERLKAMENSHSKLRAENEELRRRETGQINLQQPDPLQENNFIENVFNSSKKSLLEESEPDYEANNVYPGSPVLTRRSSGKAGLYRYLLATMMIFAVFSGLKIKVGKITKRPERLKVTKNSELIEERDVIITAPSAPDIPILPPQKENKYDISLDIWDWENDYCDLPKGDECNLDVDMGIMSQEGKKDDNIADMKLDVEIDVDVDVGMHVDLSPKQHGNDDIDIDVATDVEVQVMVNVEVEYRLDSDETNDVTETNLNVDIDTDVKVEVDLDIKINKDCKEEEEDSEGEEEGSEGEEDEIEEYYDDDYGDEDDDEEIEEGSSEYEEEEEENRFLVPVQDIFLTNTAHSGPFFKLTSEYNSTFEGVVERKWLEDMQKFVEHWRDQFRESSIKSRRKPRKTKGKKKPASSEFENQRMKKTHQEIIKQDVMEKRDTRDDFNNSTAYNQTIGFSEENNQRLRRGHTEISAEL